MTAMKAKKIDKWTNARNAIKAGNLDEGLKLYLQLKRENPVNEEVLLNLGLIYDLKGDSKKFIEYSLNAFKIYPDNPKIITRRAAVDFRLGKFNEAYQRLTSLPTDQLPFDALMILSAVCAELGKEQESIGYTMDAIKTKPSDPTAHNNLGGAFVNMGKFDEAQMCFETALMLNPDNAPALLNLGVIASKRGQFKEANEFAEKALRVYEKSNNLNEILKTKFHLSLGYLQVGDVRKGWDYYDSGLLIYGEAGRKPNRMFSVPQWDTQNLDGKTILVWREQGIGDEIFFYSTVNALRKHASKIIIESDARLVSILQRSFPDCIVRPNMMDVNKESPYTDFDYHIPVGSLYGKIFYSFDQYIDIKPYFVPNPDLVEFYNNRLGSRDGMLRVGISWRSGLMNVLRNKNYTPLRDWENVFRLKNIQFVNIQYGDVSNELANISDVCGVHINNWPDVDLKDDQEGLAALIANLDVVITVSNAPGQLAGALGVKTLWMNGQPSPYQFNVSSKYLNFPHTEVYIPDSGLPVSSLLEKVIPERILSIQAENK